jgi:CheY-like chemotaxis protein
MTTVLVVDDDPDSCHVLVKLINRFDGPAASVADGPATLRFMEGEVPQMLCLDWMMPDMSGLQVLQAMRADSRFAALPVVIFSAVSNPAVKLEALQAGAQAFVIKGQFEELFSVLKKYRKRLTADGLPEH